jgi:hypothetical protein
MCNWVAEGSSATQYQELSLPSPTPAHEPTNPVLAEVPDTSLHTIVLLTPSPVVMPPIDRIPLDTVLVVSPVEARPPSAHDEMLVLLVEEHPLRRGALEE